MRQYILTTSFLAALFLSSCTETPQSDGIVEPLADFTSANTNPTQQDNRNVENTISQTSSLPMPLTRPERYKGLDPKEISRAEFDELIALEKRQHEKSEAFRRAQQVWASQDPADRGPQPEWQDIPQTNRLQELHGKIQIAEIRKRYGNIDAKILSKADAEEYIALQQAQARLYLEHQKKFSSWGRQAPLPKGLQQEKDVQMEAISRMGNNPRLLELQAKVQSAHSVARETDRIETLSKTHNIPILDNEMSELIQLYAEEKKLQNEISRTIMTAITSGEINAATLGGGGQLEGEELIDKLPKDVLLRMSEVNQRLEAIEAPFEAAEKADKIRQEMTKLSETSGVPISFEEIEETIALNAEKDRIQKRMHLEAERKWKTEGGLLSAIQKVRPNAEDDARLKEIEARVRAIYAPMIETQ